ncbi:WxL domain-containing protein [Paenisporosarcina sp. TG20]|uniref:WxL domain-containing protein n=1 Tax=Paenisporosarcina sp. TG20 TaxID=1211706 RepID=UPI0002FC2253|nr:WxL domain-containing protein [Paenisporosarcina sp. TG20]
MNSVLKKLVTGTAVLALSMTAFASSSFATTSEITGGSLSYTGITTTNFPAITLDGKTQSITAQIDTFDITDARGTGAGWNVSVSASQFSQTAGANPLALGALLLDEPTVSEKAGVEGSSNPASITKLGGKIDLAAVKILSAAVSTGMGTYTVPAIPMTLTLMPKEIYAGTYTSTITATITSGPGS